MDGRVYNGAGVGGGQSRTTVQLHGRGFVYGSERESRRHARKQKS